MTILAVIGFGAFLVAQGLTTTGAKPGSSSTGTSPAPTAPLTWSPTSTTQSAAPQPSTGLTGIFPSADATIPPGAPMVIPDLRVEDLAAAAADEGMTCVSEAGTGPDNPAGYTLVCDGQDPAANAKLGMTVTYWALNGVSEIYFSVWGDKPGAVVNPSTPIQLMSAIGTLSSGEVAKTWVLAHLDQDGCRDACSRTEGPVRLEVQTGDYGGRALHVIAVGT